LRVPPRAARTALMRNPAIAMSNKHANNIRLIFQDPVSGNIHWRDVESLLKHLGAELESLAGARVRVKLNAVEGILHRPHKSNVLDRSSVQHLRTYLGRAGVTPSGYEESGGT
jgi:hypothetical protein